MFRPFIEVLLFDAQKCACNSRVLIVTELLKLYSLRGNLLDKKLLARRSWMLTLIELIVSGTQVHCVLFTIDCFDE